MKLNNATRTHILHSVFKQHFNKRCDDHNKACEEFAAKYLLEEVFPFEEVARTHKFPAGMLACRSSTSISLGQDVKAIDGDRLRFIPVVSTYFSAYTSSYNGVSIEGRYLSYLRFSRSAAVSYDIELSPKFLKEAISLAKQADKLIHDFRETQQLLVPIVAAAKTTEQLEIMYPQIKDHIPATAVKAGAGLPISIDVVNKLNELLK